MIEYKIYFISLLILINIEICQSQQSLESFVKEYSKPIEQSHPDNEDFTDLEFLNEVLSDKRIVLLGEITHNNGAAKEISIRLIKYLHEKLGFDVIITEKNIYETQKNWIFLTLTKTPDFIKLKEFGIILILIQLSLTSLIM